MKIFRMIKVLQNIGCFLLVGLKFSGCASQTEQPEKSKQALASSDSKPTISDSLVKALVDFNRGAALLEQYNYLDAAKAFESVLEAAPDWPAPRFDLGLAHFKLQEKS